jgi:hypothetical protein
MLLLYNPPFGDITTNIFRRPDSAEGSRNLPEIKAYWTTQLL